MVDSTIVYTSSVHAMASQRLSLFLAKQRSSCVHGPSIWDNNLETVRKGVDFLS